ncbi:MAG TPA: hypothetical protein VMT12_14000 [Syntrophales bacterium]|nr:hypothetical protein [Syntrophales bacterium]
MIVFCEECGEKYIIENSEIKEKVIMFNCRICTDTIKVSVPDNMVVAPANNEETRN